MNPEKIQTIETNLKQIFKDSSYVDSLTRIVREFIENKNENIKQIDILNSVILLEKHSQKLHTQIAQTLHDLEF